VLRDVIAGLIGVALVVVALLLAAALHYYRARRLRDRQDALGRGRRVVAELPLGPDLTLFTEDHDAFYLGARPIPKRDIQAARVLINGSPIAAAVSPRFPEADRRPPSSFDDQPDGIARDRWDVAIETTRGMVLVECGAIRERISQELARAIFEAVKAAILDRPEGSEGAGDRA
jgi:hypothetical protein